MQRKHKRLWFIVFILSCLAGSVGLSLYALRDNVSFFYSPQEVQAFLQSGNPVIAPGRVFRLGGLVKAGSLQKRDGDLAISFVVTDRAAETPVEYKGILPDLFREGQGVVAKGSLDVRGVFVASELLAKHDEAYMPPEVKKALEKAHQEGAGRAE